MNAPTAHPSTTEPTRHSADEGHDSMTTTWPSFTFDWFAELEANNDKEWFDANKDRYRRIEDASRSLLDHIAELHGGEPKIFRLRRDSRFSQDQPPYKTTHRAGLRRPDGIVQWIDIDATGITVAIGHPVWDKEQLAAARAALSEPTIAGELAEALAEVAAVGFSVDPPELQRPIKGLAEDHPHPDLTRHKHLAASRHHERPGWISDGDVWTRITDDWLAARPIVEWLVRHVPAGTM